MFAQYMEEEDTINFILFVVLLLGMIWIFYKMSGVKRPSQKEGFEGAITSNGLTYNAKSFNTDITNNIEKLKESINLSKYRSDYESIITNYEEYIQLLASKAQLTSNRK